MGTLEWCYSFGLGHKVSRVQAVGVVDYIKIPGHRGKQC